MSAMALLIPLLWCFTFLVLGAAAFVVCVTTPPLRRYALSAALWWALWGPCLTFWALFSAMVGVAGIYGLNRMGTHGLHVEQWARGFGIGLGMLVVLSTAAVASTAAVLHQALVRRMTFALFRVYATAVSAAIGSVVGFGLGVLAAAYGVGLGWPVFMLAMIALVGGFGYFAWRGTRGLRGSAPERMAWVTAEEFRGG